MSETSMSHNIAQADPGQHAEYSSHNRIEAMAERRLCAGNGKERQASRIEGQHEIA
jgi:hypothetical protein